MLMSFLALMQCMRYSETFFFDFLVCVYYLKMGASKEWVFYNKDMRNLGCVLKIACLG